MPENSQILHRKYCEFLRGKVLIILGVAGISAHLTKLMVSIYQVFSGFTTCRLVWAGGKFKSDWYGITMGTSQIGTGRSWVHVRLIPNTTTPCREKIPGPYCLSPTQVAPDPQLHDNWCFLGNLEHHVGVVYYPVPLGTPWRNSCHFGHHGGIVHCPVPPGTPWW
jgi:hypothetical protein